MDEEGLFPFDLTAPARLLFPVYTPIREEGLTVHVLALGDDEAASFKIFRHRDGRVTYQVSVPCDLERRCHSCECDSTHYITLTDEQAVSLRGMVGVDRL